MSPDAPDSGPPDDGTPINYALRVSPRAALDREEIRARFEELEGDVTAMAWNAEF